MADGRQFTGSARDPLAVQQDGNVITTRIMETIQILDSALTSIFVIEEKLEGPLPQSETAEKNPMNPGLLSTTQELYQLAQSVNDRLGHLAKRI